MISQRETLQIEFANLMLYFSLVLFSCYSLIVRAFFKFCTSSVLNDAFKFYAKLRICSNILWLTFPTFRTIGSQNLWFSTFYKRPPLCVKGVSMYYINLKKSFNIQNAKELKLLTTNYQVEFNYCIFHPCFQLRVLTFCTYNPKKFLQLCRV